MSISAVHEGHGPSASGTRAIAPAVGPGATGRLAARMPVTVEPGVYLPDRGGVRIEDTLVVSDDGPVALTTTSRELRVLR